VWCSTTAFGVILLPADTLGVLSCFSLNLGALAFGLMLGAGVEDFFDGEEEFGEVAAGPFCETPNKRFNHWMIFTYIFTF
jgi:hypothetical protein